MALPAGRYGVTKEMLELIESGGGGGATGYDIYDDIVDVSDPVNLGFMPDILVVQTAKGSNKLCFIYVNDFATNKTYRSWIFSTYGLNNELWNLPYTGTTHNGIKSISDGVVEFMPLDADYSTDGKMHIFAIKKKED